MLFIFIFSQILLAQQEGDVCERHASPLESIFEQYALPLAKSLSQQIKKTQEQSKPETCKKQVENTHTVDSITTGLTSAKENIEALVNKVNEKIQTWKYQQQSCKPPCKLQNKASLSLEISPASSKENSCSKETLMKLRQKLNIKLIEEVSTNKEKEDPTKILLRKNWDCGKQSGCKEELYEKANDWIQGYLRAKSAEGEKLEQLCPSNCSYYSTQIHTYSNNNKSLSVDLITSCGNKMKLLKGLKVKGLVYETNICN